MILQGDTSLTPPEYARLLTAVRSPTLTVTLERYSLQFGAHDSSGSAAVEDCFDAIVAGTNLLRVWSDAANQITYQTMPSEDAGWQAWNAAGNLVAAGIDASVVISLAVTGAQARVFWYDGTNIKYFESNDSGVNWGAAQQVGAVASVTHLAATSPNQVHYATLTASNNTRLHVYEFFPPWASSSSEIYWPFVPESFDAVVGNQDDDGAADVSSIIVMCTDYPPIIGIRADGTDLVHEVNPVQGIAFIRYQNGRWSDHTEFDVVDDKKSAYPGRHELKAFRADDGWLYLCYYRESAGSMAYSHPMIAITRSKNGLKWELPYIFQHHIDPPEIMLLRGIHAYMLNSKQTTFCFSEGYTNNPQTTQDITDRMVMYQSQQGDITQAQITVANPQQVLDITAPFSGDVSMQARVKLGYYDAGDKLVVQTSLLDVDSIGGAQDVPRDQEVIIGRDIGARLLTFRSDHVVERDSHIVGGDNFESQDDSDYSGLRHTATLDGSWKTPAGDDELVLLSNESPGLAVSTYLANAWNGSIQAGIRVASTDADDWVGLVLRLYDKDNFLVVKYDATSDTIKVYDRRDDSDIGIAESAAMGWTYATWYYLKARIRYGYLWVYSSTDNITWTQRISTELPGMAALAMWTWANYIGRDIPHGKGRMGYAGHGYSDEEDSWPAVPDSSPADPDPPEAGELGDGIWVFGTVADGVFYTTNLDDANPNYYEMNDGLDVSGSRTIYDLQIVDMGDGTEKLFASTYCGIYSHPYPPVSGGKWTELIRHWDIGNLAGLPQYDWLQIDRVAWSLTNPDHSWCSWRAEYRYGDGPDSADSFYGAAVTVDGWKTVNSVNTLLWEVFRWAGYVKQTDVALGVHSPDASKEVYLAGAWTTLGVNSAPYTYGSSTGISGLAQIDYVDVNTFARALYVPYHSDSWDDSYIYWIAEGYLRLSTNKGSTFSTIVSLGGQIRHYVRMRGPKYDRSILNIMLTATLHVYQDGAWGAMFGPQFADPLGGIAHDARVKSRFYDLSIDEWAWCGEHPGGGGRVYINTIAAQTDKSGDWGVVAGGAIPHCIAREELDA